ncbi:ribosome biogenesis factor YjgA, partial [Wenyingzhuangia sp. 1_MG-2023]|nr:ribosome biogenesis factor YjgA [Wenyingzhuangia sp. 1_MG-2023]
DMPISDVLHAALEESRRIKQHGANRRHLQYIGRVMRDEDIVGIQEKIDLMDPSSDAYGRRQRQYEMWRTRLLQDNSGLND